jgi:hypothetical protein
MGYIVGRHFFRRVGVYLGSTGLFWGQTSNATVRVFGQYNTIVWIVVSNFRITIGAAQSAWVSNRMFTEFWRGIFLLLIHKLRVCPGRVI